VYKEPLEVLEAILEKAAQDVSAGQWVTVNGKHMLIPTDQFHPQHGWVKVSHGTIPESTMGRQGPGVYHGTKGDGTKVDFKEGESTHHAIGNDVYDSESGKKVGARDASGTLPIPPPVSKPRATVSAGARERAPVSPTGIVETPRGTGEGAPEPRLWSPTSSPNRFSTKPLGGGETSDNG